MVAAAFAYGHDAGTSAVVVKLTRTLLIVPIVGSTHGAGQTRCVRRAGASLDAHRAVVHSCLRGCGGGKHVRSDPAGAHPAIRAIALFTIVVALAGVGASADIAKMRAAGLRPLLLGAILWIAISITSLALARIPW